MYYSNPHYVRNKFHPNKSQNSTCKLQSLPLVTLRFSKSTLAGAVFDFNYLAISMKIHHIYAIFSNENLLLILGTEFCTIFRVLFHPKSTLCKCIMRIELVSLYTVFLSHGHERFPFYSGNW